MTSIAKQTQQCQPEHQQSQSEHQQSLDTNQRALIERWQSVVDEVAAATQLAKKEQGSVQLLAVSKTKPAEMIATLASQGQQHFGENYLQEALSKIATLKEAHPTLVWHYIGSIQRNKTRDIAQNFDWVHTIERQIIAKRLNEQRPTNLPKLNVLIQLNIDEEESKSGCLPSELDQLVNEIKGYENLQLRGLMIIPSKVSHDADDGAGDAVNPFARTEGLFEQIAKNHPELSQWDTLSMGMSADMKDAVVNGSTIVRVGTAIFGARDYR